jgi:dTDP-4-dehydrorhamnose 3,5-epimerase
MRFEQTSIPGAVLVEIEPHRDIRGFLARTFCEHEFAAAGLPTRFVQSSVSRNPRRGTLRGMHFQALPSHEAKLVRCTRGSIYDVALDLRPSSISFRRWVGVELSGESGAALFIPQGCAHGFQTLEDDVEVLYSMTDFHAPDLAHGVRWNDPAFGIVWPIDQPILSDRDAAYQDFVL